MFRERIYNRNTKEIERRVEDLKIILDAMGGDFAPKSNVCGAVLALGEIKDLRVVLVGEKDQIKEALKGLEYDRSRLTIVDTKEVITNDDIPTKAIKQKKDSSLVVALNMLKDNLGDALVSAGSTGAVMTGGLLLLGRIRGVDRPALPTVLDVNGTKMMIIDSGANTSCKPMNYVQFGIMGSMYMRNVYGVENPRVGLLNIGAEEKKGNEITKQAYQALKEADINFVGNVEGNEVTKGKADVIVCDGFSGNILLKFAEGLGEFFKDGLRHVFTSSIMTKIAYLTVEKNIRSFFKGLDPSEIGGVPLLGIKGNIIKCHGRSDKRAIRSALVTASRFDGRDIINGIEQKLK